MLKVVIFADGIRYDLFSYVLYILKNADDVIKITYGKCVGGEMPNFYEDNKYVSMDVAQTVSLSCRLLSGAFQGLCVLPWWVPAGGAPAPHTKSSLG